jgi:hypothetical protein
VSTPFDLFFSILNTPIWRYLFDIVLEVKIMKDRTEASKQVLKENPSFPLQELLNPDRLVIDGRIAE